MAPRALFDKSFLQSLTLDESSFFDSFFHSVVAPIFYVEALADLEKAVRAGRTQEDEVGILADKVPEMHVAPTVYHRDLAIQNLLGVAVPLDGKMLASGKVLKSGQHLSIINDAPKESEAYQRWRDRDFLDVERRFAKQWRKTLSEIDLAALAAGVRALGITSKNCSSLQEAKARAVGLVEANSVPNLIKLAIIIIGGSRTLEEFALARWKESGSKPFAEYAAYIAHIVTVEVFFQIALAADLIGSARVSNRTDMAYLFYLPFCNVFISSDDLHRKCAHLFLRGDQTFLWGPDLKADLTRLVEHYKALPDDVKDQGIVSFAPRPPAEDDGLIAKLWDQDDDKWREAPKPVLPEVVAAIEELIKTASSGPQVSGSEIHDFSDVGRVEMNRQVRYRKGSFWLGPNPESPDR
jgi:hypothetical protein